MSTTVKSPLVSVVALSYNHERWLLETLESIKGQTFCDFELIYADDASSDKSVETALSWLAHQSFPVTTIIHEKNRGVCATLNEALSHCRGRYFQSIACDDLLISEKLASQVALLEAAAPDVALLQGQMTMIDAEGKPLIPEGANDGLWPIAERRDNPDMSFERLLQGGFCSLQSSLIRCDAIRAVGGFDERLTFEDWDLWLRLSRRYRLVYQPEVTVAYRVLSSGLHNHMDRTDYYWIIRKHIDRPEARSALKAAAYGLYRNGRLSDDVRRDFLRCVRQFPDMRVQFSDYRTLYNEAIRMKVPPQVFSSMGHCARGVRRFAGAFQRRCPAAG